MKDYATDVHGESRFVKACQSFGRALRRSTPLTSRVWTPRPQFVTCIAPSPPRLPGGKAVSVRQGISAPAVFVMEFQPIRLFQRRRPMPSDHRLTARDAVSPQDVVGEIFIGGSNKAIFLRAVTEDYFRRSGVTSNWITG